MNNAEKIAAINKYQNAGYVHELTCGNSSSHKALRPVERNGRVILICDDCDYVQSWIPEYCFDLPPNPMEALMTQPQQNQNQVDMLTQIFDMQEELNNKTFVKNGLKDSMGYDITIARIQSDVCHENFGPNHLPCLWLRNYLTAMEAECKELREELPWKWWSKDKIDMQNIRVEIVDQLHFLVSLAQAANLSASELHRLYMAKHEVNNQRQDNGYSQATKTEADNKTIV